MSTCPTCGREGTTIHSFTCSNCWEIDQRLPEYLKSVNGRHAVALLLAKALEEVAGDDSVKLLRRIVEEKLSNDEWAFVFEMNTIQYYRGYTCGRADEQKYPEKNLEKP